jgi:hypothetical protein
MRVSDGWRKKHRASLSCTLGPVAPKSRLFRLLCRKDLSLFIHLAPFFGIFVTVLRFVVVKRQPAVMIHSAFVSFKYHLFI